MNIVLKDSDTFKKIINCLKDLITESGELTFDSRGISIQCMDTTKVVLIDMLLEKGSFDKYELDSDKEIGLALNFENLNNVLKLSKSAHVGISYKTGAEKLGIQLNERINKKIQFDMMLSNDIEKTELEVTEIKYDIKIYIDATEFQKSIKDLSSFGKNCSIVVDENDITFSVTGTVGTGKITLSDVEIEYENDKKEYTGLFDIKYLNFFAKAGLSNEIILKFGNGVPFCFEYMLDGGFIKFYQSQIQED